MTKTNLLKRAFPTFLAVILFASPAHANVIIPLIVTGWFGIVVLLVPIILVEWLVVARLGAHIWESLLAVSTANLISTLAGFPIALVLEGVVGATTPYYRLGEGTDVPRHLSWTVSACFVLFLVLFFMLSWWIEAEIVAWFLAEFPLVLVDLAVRDANIATYVLVGALLIAVFALTALVRKGRKIMSRIAERKTVKMPRST